MRLRLGKGPVSCRICQHENPAGARFCNECGAHLAAPTLTPEPRAYPPRHLVETILAAQRACAAALDLARELGALAEDVRRESGLEFAVRMGLNSGEVVVGRIGDDLRMDYTAQGHVVGLAARVQQLAPPGGITVTEQTA